jgi:hypothetical protein
MRIRSLLIVLCALVVATVAGLSAADKPADNRNGADKGFVALFPDEGVPRGWTPRDWSDVSKPPGDKASVWKVENGVLHGSEPRGTWLVSEKEYGDFILELDFKIGPEGNSGVGFRFPDHGDPAFDGMELQICDERYYTKHGQEYGPASLTGSIYNAIPPQMQVYKPTEWNHYEISCQGPRVRVVLNLGVIQDFNLDEQTKKLERGTPLKDRPRKGHLGFQELSRGGGHVEIRNARIKVLNEG